MATILNRSSLPYPDPVFETLRTPGRESRGAKIGWLAEQLGFPLMPWQQQVAAVGSELVAADDQIIEMFAARGVDASGMLVPAYREVIVTVMRQSGKTTLVLPVEFDVLWHPRTTVAYTAQTGLDGRQKFTEDQRPIIESSRLNQKVRRFYQAADNTGMWLHNGSRLKVLNTGESAGHGKTLDLAVLDETWHDSDDSREQALSPAMITKPQAQFWNLSTAGTPKSLFLKRKVALGRAAAKSGKREGIAYFEWTIPEEEDVYSPAVWAKYMPAYGITQSERILRFEAERMKEGEFRRAYGNQWTATVDRVIPEENWRQVVKPGLDMDQSRSLFAVDAKPDRSKAAVVAADAEGRLELVATGRGVTWLADWFAAKPERTKNRKLAVDAYGPVAGIVDDLEEAYDQLDVVRLDSLAVRKACGRFYDAVTDNQLQVRGDEEFDTAVEHASTRTTSDAWRWSREPEGGEILMAASIGYHTAVTDPEDSMPMVAWV